MLTVDEIKQFIDEDARLPLKKHAREGQRYYEGMHDILNYRMFYYNADGMLVEDKYRSNSRIPHPFFTELVDQAAQYVLSGKDGIVMSDDTELQAELDKYFNKNKRFMVELAETVTGMQAKGFDYMYAYKKNDTLTFENADCLGVVEVEGRFADDGKDQRIYRYLDIIDKDQRKQWKILVIDDENTYYYKQEENGDIVKDDDVKQNPRPHALYEKDGELYKKDFGFLPFFRLDNNKKRKSLLPAVKALIDDYDLMASSLSNNLVDFDTPIHVVSGFQGDNLDELQTNLKTKKMIGVDEGGGLEVKTVDVPYQARKEKLELDEKNIYRFGMGLNMFGLKDTTATTNIAIKAMYSLLDLRASKMIDQLEVFLEEVVKVVLAEINAKNGTDFQMSQVYFNFEPEIMSNAQENATIALTEAQEQQARINTLLALNAQLGNELVVQQICDVLDLEYEQIKNMLPDPDEAQHSLNDAFTALNGGDVVE